ncbi:MAG: YicC family protein [Clostridia bacterium]|nr:YicC family protein [Clostridia bacterium]MBR0303358.1 YicC family protein [Clostridia bacterium]
MYSMTGYGRGEAERNGRTLVVELKSVNHRFLDLSIKLPRVLLFAEDAMKKVISSRLSRGHIDVFTTYTAPAEQGALSLDRDLAASYLAMGKELAQSFGVKDDLTASALLRVQGVVTENAVAAPEEELVDLVRTATDRALDSLLKMRDVEGKAITADIMTKLAEIERLTGLIESRAPLVTAEYRTRLEERMREALSGADYDETRLLTEVALFADKCAIDEELARLHAHIDHYRSILSTEPAAGRKLDFLTQELNREANTIGSKCNDAAIAENVVLLKCEIEKVREQIQNLE